MRGLTPAQDAERFWAKVRRSDPDACWLWAGRKGANGYGTIIRNNRFIYSHRHSWCLTNGAIPPGLFVCHRCDVPLCVNPGHLFLGTNADNMADAAKKGRSASGERGGTAKLTQAQVNDIRAALRAGESRRCIARRFGVGHSAINVISSGKGWRHSYPGEGSV